MAGETYWFIGALERWTDFKEVDFGATPNPIKCALVTNTPSTTVDQPTWGGSGTDLQVNEVAATGNYTAGGKDCANPTTTRVGSVLQFDWDNPTRWDQNALNPTNALCAVFYDTVTLNCICYMALGSVIDMSAADLTITMGTPALTATAATP